MRRKALIQAVRNGRTKMVFLLLGIVSEVNFTDEDGASPLMLAARLGHDSID